eukprot:gene9591-biopygen9269
MDYGGFGWQVSAGTPPPPLCDQGQNAVQRGAAGAALGEYKVRKGRRRRRCPCRGKNEQSAAPQAPRHVEQGGEMHHLPVYSNLCCDRSTLRSPHSRGARFHPRQRIAWPHHNFSRRREQNLSKRWQTLHGLWPFRMVYTVWDGMGSDQGGGQAAHGDK